MREIKFRAWDKKKKKMVDNWLHYGGALFSTLPWDEPFLYRNQQYPELELMQYTGLRDKHGVEIYEGDMVLLGRILVPQLVYWDENSFQYRLRNPKISYQYDKTHLLDFAKTGKVVGNIWEQGTEG